MVMCHPEHLSRAAASYESPSCALDMCGTRAEEGALYVSIHHATAVHVCTCGCRCRVVTPLGPTEKWADDTD